MSVSYISKTILQQGDDEQLVKKYDEVAIEYTGKHRPSRIGTLSDNM